MPDPSEIERLYEAASGRIAFIEAHAAALVERLDARVRQQAITIGELEKTVKTLRAERFALHDELTACRKRCEGLAERVAAQSELLSKRAEKPDAFLTDEQQRWALGMEPPDA